MNLATNLTNKIFTLENKQQRIAKAFELLDSCIKELITRQEVLYRQFSTLNTTLPDTKELDVSHPIFNTIHHTTTYHQQTHHHPNSTQQCTSSLSNLIYNRRNNGPTITTRSQTNGLDITTLPLWLNSHLSPSANRISTSLIRLPLSYLTNSQSLHTLPSVTQSLQ